MAFMITKMSPQNTLVPVPEFFLAIINTSAPVIPSNNPRILNLCKCSFKINAAMMVIKIGVVNINKEA